MRTASMSKWAIADSLVYHNVGAIADSRACLQVGLSRTALHGWMWGYRGRPGAIADSPACT